MGRHFPVRENHTKYWTTEEISEKKIICYFSKRFRCLIRLQTDRCTLPACRRHSIFQTWIAALSVRHFSSCFSSPSDSDDYKAIIKSIIRMRKVTLPSVFLQNYLTHRWLAILLSHMDKKHTEDVAMDLFWQKTSINTRWRAKLR